MTSRTDTNKRRVLANHLKKSIDVLEEKAREVKRYADALECVSSFTRFREDGVDRRPSQGHI